MPASKWYSKLSILLFMGPSVVTAGTLTAASPRSDTTLDRQSRTVYARESILSRSISPLPIAAGGYPVGLTLCTIDQNLQECLDKNQKIRLERADYRNQKLSRLLIRSGQQIFGLPGTYLPEVQLAAGTEKAILSTITTPKLTFAPSTANNHNNPNSPIRFNLFVRVNASFQNIGAAVEQNIFTYCNGPLNVDTRASGYLRNNRFIGSHAHGPSDMIEMVGDSDQQSYGNVFLWYNFLTPRGKATRINNQRDITFIGIDGEAWNFYGEDQNWSPLLDLDRIRTLRILGANGGNYGEYQTPYLRANASQVQILNMNVFSAPHDAASSRARGSPWYLSSGHNLLNTISLGVDNKVSWISNYCCDISVSSPSLGSHFDIFKSEDGQFKLDNVASSKSIGNSDVDSLHDLFAPINRPGVPWEEVRLGALPDPAGPNWNALVANAKENGVDDWSRIQNLIDTSPNGVAFLPPGVYYIGRSIVLGKNKGLIGAGRDKTVILALSRSLNMVVPGDSDRPNEGGTQRFILSDLTLQGGHSGIYYSSSNTGPYSQLNDVFLSYVQFREMSDAGILSRDIYGWDNNFFDHLAFVNCVVGFRQLFPTAPKRGENSDNNYVDKVIFYRSQFIGNRLGVELSANRADNLNAFVQSLFKDNRGGAVFLQNARTTIFAGSKFINNGGTAISMSNARFTSIVGCQFTAGSMGKFLFSSGLNVEGSMFSEGENGNAEMFESGAENAVILNSTSNIPLGHLRAGAFVNNRFPDADLNRFFVLLIGGSKRIMSRDYSDPKPQMLWGASL